MNYILQKAKSEELEEIYGLYEARIRWMDENGVRQWNVTGYLEMYPISYFEMQQRAERLYVLKDETGRISGAVVLLEEDPRWEGRLYEAAFYVHNLVAAPGAKGAGREMLQEMERIAREKNKEFLHLDCDVDSEFLNSYYGSKGFELAGNCEDGMYKGNRRQKRLRK